MGEVQPVTHDEVNDLARNKKSNFLRLLGFGFAFLAIFSLGVGVGNGRIAVGPNAGFLVSQNKQLPEDLDYKTVEQVYDSLKANFDGELDAESILDGLKEGLVKSSGDPYTEYFNPEDAEAFNEELTGTFSGIGAELSKEKELIVVVAPIAGFPAEKAGLRPRDVIAEIDGESAYDLTITEAVNKIRGPSGTKVKLKVIRDNSQTLDIEITRQTITIPSVTHEIQDNNVGYIKVSRFAEDTVRLSYEAARDLKAKGATSIILDMRGNPGGLLDAAVDLSSLWLDKGATILEEKRGGTVVKTFKATGNNPLKGLPTVVLIDQGSASASEITAGALRDNGAAKLIGDKSFGKGSVQSLINLGDGALLKVTIARWFTPAGDNIDQEGIKPDQEVKLTEEDQKNKRDPQLEAAKIELKR